jgi:tRNA(Ile2)-agmatinylcytidine synthase
LHLIGYPKLVRLNPNIPWKTRGNGAICLELGVGSGKKFEVGYAGRTLFGYPEGQPESKFAPNSEKRERILGRIQKIVEKYSHMDEENTNPAVIIFWKKPSKYVYSRVLTKMLTVDDIKIDIYRLGDFATYKAYKNERGLIGATAACGWGEERYTYELITYRHPKRWGKKRVIKYDSVDEMDQIFSSTFDNIDRENKHMCIVPNSPCPVLYGIRGESTVDLVDAKELIKSKEKPDRWLLFKTNQGTDDHIEVMEDIMDLVPYKSVVVRGEISEEVRTEKGGHVFFTILDDSGFIDCAAYEPTKQFRDVVRKLEVGDIIQAYGGVREEPFTVNLEKIKLEDLAEVTVKDANPICPKCKKSMESVGKNKGYRCRKCKKKIKEDQVEMIPVLRDLEPGFYEVPACARRHLAMPLKRGNPKEVPPLE